MPNIIQRIINMEKNSFKIVLIGDSGVGKTSIVHWFLGGGRLTDTFPTIGASYAIKEILIDEKKIRLSVWDTAGQERFRSVIKIYYRDTVGCLCTFALNDGDSFKHLNYWLGNYRDCCNNSNHEIILVANKADIPESKWATSRKEIESFAEKQNCKLMFTNCITGEGIAQLFELLGQYILQNGYIGINEIKKDNINVSWEANPLIEKFNTCVC